MALLLYLHCLRFVPVGLQPWPGAWCRSVASWARPLCGSLVGTRSRSHSRSRSRRSPLRNLRSRPPRLDVELRSGVVHRPFVAWRWAWRSSVGPEIAFIGSRCCHRAAGLAAAGRPSSWRRSHLRSGRFTSTCTRPAAAAGSVPEVSSPAALWDSWQLSMCLNSYLSFGALEFLESCLDPWRRTRPEPAASAASDWRAYAAPASSISPRLSASAPTPAASWLLQAPEGSWHSPCCSGLTSSSALAMASTSCYRFD